MGRGSFHAKILVLLIKNGHLSSIVANLYARFNVGGLAKCYQREWSRKMLSTWVVPTPIFAPTPKSQITPPIFLDPPSRALITPNHVPTHSSQFPSSPPYPKDHLNIICPNLPKVAQDRPRIAFVMNLTLKNAQDCLVWYLAFDEKSSGKILPLRDFCQ